MLEARPDSGAEAPAESVWPQRRILLDVLWLLFLTLFAFEIREWRIGLPATQYFDEVYYVKAAKEYLSIQPDSNTVHPPLGKLLIAAFIYLYQHVAQPLWAHGFLDIYTESAGWRMGTLIFGTAMIPLTWWLGFHLFRSRFVAVVSSFLLTIDFLHVVQSRIAMLDMFLAFFILLASITAWCYLEKPSGGPGWILVTAILLGLGAGCKWNSLFAAVGIYVAMVMLKPGPLDRSFIKRSLGIGATFAIVIPLMYILCFIPFFKMGGTWQQLYDNHHTMVTFRYGPDFTHRYMSKMWQWPTDVRPVWYFYEEHETGDYSMFPKNKNTFWGRVGWRKGEPDKYVYGVIAMGSWFVWWFFLLFFALTVVQCVIIPLCTLRRTTGPEGEPLEVHPFDEWRFGPNRPWLFLILMYAPQLLLWSVNKGFLFYMLPCLPYMCILIAAILEEWQELRGGKACIAIFLALALFLFMAYYPLLTDYPVPEPIYKALIFRESWI